MRYMVWNNKGGVGKTFLTYSVAAEYALAHPDRPVAVVDMCPQANVSEMILGGDGKGESELAKFAQNGLTIAGYIKKRYSKSPVARLGTENGYFCRAQTINPEMPPNLYLLPGDVDLDICAGLIAYMGNAPQKNAWCVSRRLLDDLLSAFENGHDNSVIFVDCNPSFAVYTETVAVATNEIIVPCTADNASIRGILNLFRLVYGRNAYQLLGIQQSIDDEYFTFSQLASANGFVLPRIRMVILNKSRSLDASATQAWQAHRGQIMGILAQVQSAFPDSFCPNIDSLVFDVKDGNTLATIANYTGLPISNIHQGRYDIYGVSTVANQSQVEALTNQLSVVVSNL